jgi:hypothetical protein
MTAAIWLCAALSNQTGRDVSFITCQLEDSSKNTLITVAIHSPVSHSSRIKATDWHVPVKKAIFRYM